MSDQAFTRLETRLERLIEGAFGQLFGQALRPHDIVIHLSRALEDGIVPANDHDPRPFAPDRYRIRLNPDVYDHLLIRQPRLSEVLTQHMVELTTAAGCRARSQPLVELVADEKLHADDIRIETPHLQEMHNTTQLLSQAGLEAAFVRAPHNPVLVIDGETTIALDRAVITIGRGRENDIVLRDRYASRQHAQVRLRHRSFTVFDANSQSGITVNDVPVREHRLQPGDVLVIGKTKLLYLEDTSVADQTDVIDVQDLR